MDVEFLLSAGIELFTFHTGKAPNDWQIDVLRGTLENKTYSQIAEGCGCVGDDYAKGVGKKLFDVFSALLKTKVTKKNFRNSLEKYLCADKFIHTPRISPHKSTQKASATDLYDYDDNPPYFVELESAIAELNVRANQGEKIILIQAEGGVGKTTLADQYFKIQKFDIVLHLQMPKERQNISSVESRVKEWLQKKFNEESGREFGINLERLRSKLEDRSKKIGIFIDNLEPALKNGRFIENHRDYVELLKILSHPTVQSLTLVTSREPIYEEGIRVWPYHLKELSKQAWNKFFTHYGINTGEFPLDENSALSLMHKAYGGNAEAMFIFNGDIRFECQGNLEAYWEENKDDLLRHPTLENLIQGQFKKLQKDEPFDYKLLCRLGCCRYQDIPLVPKEGMLCLLWDVPEERRRGVIKSLCNRSLVKRSNQEFYIHPVIKAEAINRLKESQDWEATNRKIAEFWTEGVETIETVEDALRAFEAYYHYFVIKDFESCGMVCIKCRINKWGAVNEALGVSFYRLGLLQPMINEINRIKNHIKSKYILTRLYNILGDLYWQSGYLQQAITSHDDCEIISDNALKYREKVKNENLITLNKLKAASFLNRGLCNLDLWNIEDAIFFFTKCKKFIQENNLSERYLSTCYCCLSFAYSCINDFKETSYFAEKAELEKKVGLSIWANGYSLLFLGMAHKNLGKIEKSFKIYTKAKLFAKNTYYTQLEAKIFTGLAELYRGKQEFDLAFKYHSKSIELLDKLCAKCDLAEAYFQQALTNKKVGNIKRSEENRDIAIQLFNQIEAPKQIEKVKQAMLIESD